MNFQLYRGNLHKVPDVPWQWPVDKPTISLQLFKKAIAKRQEALLAYQKLGGEHNSDALVHQESHAFVQQDSRVGDEADGHEHGCKRKREHSEASGMEMEADEDLPSGSKRKCRTCAETNDVMAEDMALDGADCIARQPFPHGASDVKVKGEGEDADMASNEMENVAAPEDSNLEKEGERLEAPRTPAAKDEDCTKPIERIQTRGPHGCNSHDEVPSVAAKRAEIQEKLKQLQETKHQLVQILKQVLITEEESKRKSQGLSQYLMYGTVGTADLSLDQKMASDLQSADLEEGELDYTRNPGPPVLASSYGSHFSEFHPQTLGTTPGRQFNHQLSK